MKILKRTLLLGLAALMVVPTVSANSGGMNLSETIDKKIEKAVVLYENSNVALINGVRKEIDIMNTDITPIEMDDRTLVPVKFVSESLGASVFWDDKTNTVSVSHGENLAKMKIGENVIEVNKDSIEIDVPATIINDVTMLPLRVISEKVLNKEVYWNDGLIGISDEKLEFSNPEISGVTERITQAPVYQRPYFPPTLKEKDGAIERADAILEKWTDEEYWCENFVPKQSPRINQYSPVKETGFKSNWKWDSEKPNEILDAASGLVFPNADYPYKYKDVTVFSGKVVSVPYLECYNTKMSKNVLVEAKIDAEKGRFLDKALSDLATAYTMTKDEKYARRVILSLDKWAEYLPDYFITRGWNLNEPISVEEAEKIDFKRVEWASDNNGFAAEMTLPQVKAIDYTFDSKTFEELSKEKGYDVRKNIEENFYGKKLEYFTKTVPVESFYATNLALAYGYFGQVATVLDKMDTIKKLGEYSTTSMDINFKRDKMLPESGTYHFYYARENRDVAMTLKKYFDIYPDKISENQDIYNKVNEQIDFLTKAMAAVNKFSYPDGNIAPYADCDKGITLKRNKSVSELMPGYGVAHLADGEFENQTVFNIGAIDTCGHTHYDRNSIQLFGFGEELIGDIRYARMPGRKYCNDSTFSHNTVIVDGKDQPVMSEVVKNQNYGNDGHAFNGGNISMFNDSIDGISVSEVNNAYAYDEANRYQRLNILNTKEEDKPYVLDVFVVEGGNRHEYMLHSSTQFDSTRKSDIEMEKLVGNDPERPLMEKGDTWEEFKFNIDSKENYYGIFKNVDYAENDGNYKVSFTKADGDVGLNIIMASDENETLYIGDAPTPYRDKAPAKVEDLYENYTPFLMARREGENLKSIFVSVLEPFKGEGKIESVKQLPLDSDDDNHLAVEVLFKDGRRDTMLINLNNASEFNESTSDVAFSTKDEKYLLDGRIGISSTAFAPVMFGANEFKANDTKIGTNTGEYKGNISDITSVKNGDSENTFITSADLPEGKELSGTWLSLYFGKYTTVNFEKIKEQSDLSEMYEIDYIEKKDDKTYIHLKDDSCLKKDGNTTSELVRPMRTFEGDLNFKIYTSFE